MSDVIEIRGLRKEYRRMRSAPTLAIDGLDLSVPAGGVYGFLGPNGSGKTTTIRCLMGLIGASGGQMRMLGADVPSGLGRVIGRVGSIVETPALFPTFTGRRNLELLGRIHGIGQARVNDVLARVGLADRADEIVKHYSLGMKQRLGIGSALLRDPELLILDEPANGLDPAGIKEVRDLMRSLAEEGRTVFVSSHLLGEVQATCDRVAILARGRAVAAGPVKEVLSAGGTAGVLVRAGDPEKAAEVLNKAKLSASVRGDMVSVRIDPMEAGAVTKALAAKRIYLTEMRPDEMDLETVFLRLTGAPEPPAPPAPEDSP